MGIHIVTAGAFTTVQDYGRVGYGEIGFSRAGAVDRDSMELANLLVGNPLGEAVLECTMLGPTIIFLQDTVIAVTGAYMMPKIEQTEISMNSAILVKAGQVLELGLAQSGCRSYISFAGGLEIEEYLGSKSTDIKCKVGGFCGRALRINDEISLVHPGKFVPWLEKRSYPRYQAGATPQTIRVVLGPQADYFTEEGIHIFLTSIYQITDQANRMACKLAGPCIASRQGYDIVSDGISLGSIQVSANGQPILMLADRQTTGGYAKIATVISVDIATIAQLRPGDMIYFKKISIEEAHTLYRQRVRETKKLQKKLNRRLSL